MLTLFFVIFQTAFTRRNKKMSTCIMIFVPKGLKPNNDRLNLPYLKIINTPFSPHTIAKSDLLS